MPAAGCVEISRMHAAVEAAGYTGPIEVEIFNDEVWARPGVDVLREAMDGYRASLV